MGVAAYNRGTKAISAAIDATMPTHLSALLDDVSDASVHGSGVALFYPTVIRRGPRPGEWSIMNRQKGGWAEYAYTYESLWEIAKAWRFIVTGNGRDAHGPFFEVSPARACNCKECRPMEARS